MRPLSLMFSAVLAAGLCTTAPAQDWTRFLTPEMEAELPSTALVHYNEAKQLVDIVAYDLAVEALARAAELAPDHVGLQFLTAVRARDRAEIYFSSSTYSPPPPNADYSSPPWRTAEPFYDIADEAIQRLLTNPNLTIEASERLESEVAQLQEGRDGLVARDQARLEVGGTLVSDIRARRFGDYLREAGLQDMDPLDPATPFIEMQQAAREEEEVLVAEGEEEVDEGPQPRDPFKDLPGEYRSPFLPPPPQQPQYGGAGGYYGGANQPYDPFAASPPGVDPVTGTAYDQGFGGEDAAEIYYGSGDK